MWAEKRTSRPCARRSISRGGSRLSCPCSSADWFAVPDMRGKSLEEADAESAARRDVADRSLLPATAERSAPVGLHAELPTTSSAKPDAVGCGVA